MESALATSTRQPSHGPVPMASRPTLTPVISKPSWKWRPHAIAGLSTNIVPIEAPSGSQSALRSHRLHIKKLSRRPRSNPKKTGKVTIADARAYPSSQYHQLTSFPPSIVPMRRSLFRYLSNLSKVYDCLDSTSTKLTAYRCPSGVWHSRASSSLPKL